MFPDSTENVPVGPPSCGGDIMMLYFIACVCVCCVLVWYVSQWGCVCVCVSVCARVCACEEVSVQVSVCNHIVGGCV